MTILSPLRRLAGVAALFSAVALGASPSHADDFRIDDAWKAALEDAGGVLTDKQQAVVNEIAYSAAAALLCDGLDIDAPDVAKAIDAVLKDGPKDLTDDQQLERYTDILLMLGTAKGIILSEGALHKQEFCASAVAEKADAKNDTMWK